MIADSEIDIAASRLLIWQACAELDEGRSAAQSSSIAKTFVAEAVGRVVDRSLQICGALGISGDVLLSRYYREVRPFRIYDGSSETHRWAIAKRRLRQDARTGRHRGEEDCPCLRSSPPSRTIAYAELRRLARRPARTDSLDAGHPAAGRTASPTSPTTTSGSTSTRSARRRARSGRPSRTATSPCRWCRSSSASSSRSPGSRWR